MPQTVLELQRLIRHTLGGDDPASETPAIQIINEAGNHLINMRRWNFLDREATALNLAASQAWLDLPADFGEVIQLHKASNMNGDMVPVSPHEIDYMRASPTLPVMFTLWWAIEWVGSNAQTPPTARVAIYPTPTANVIGAVILRYRATWTTLNADADFAVIPVWCETLLRQLVIAFARGYMEEDTATLDERLELISQGSVFKACERRDSVVQVNMGQMTGGAAQMFEGGGNWRKEIPVSSPVNV